MTDILQQIDAEIKNNDVILFMKGTPDFPMCGFSGKVSAILRHLDISFKSVNILEDDKLRQGIKEYSNWPTIPQLYIKGEFIGGSDITTEMFESGELLELLKSKGIA